MATDPFQPPSDPATGRPAPRPRTWAWVLVLVGPVLAVGGVAAPLLVMMASCCCWYARATSTKGRVSATSVFTGESTP